MMDTQGQDRKLVFQPKWAIYIFGGIEIIAIIFSLTGQYLRMFPDSYHIHTVFQEKLIRDFTEEFDVNSEANITTYFSVTMAMLSAFLFFVIAYLKNAAKDRFRFQWAALGVFLLYISMDDASVIHEKSSKYLKGLSSLGGWFEYKWVFIGITVIVIMGILFFNFWLHLDNKYKALLLISAAIFFGGAVGVEILGGRFAYTFGSKNFSYVLFTTWEQGSQYAGLILLIYSLLHYIKSYFPWFSVSSKGLMDGSGDARQGAK
jgi:hypothetical protein